MLTPVHLATMPLASVVLGLSISVEAVRRTWRLTSLGVALRMGGGLMLGVAAAWKATGTPGSPVAGTVAAQARAQLAEIVMLPVRVQVTPWIVAVMLQV